MALLLLLTLPFSVRRTHITTHGEKDIYHSSRFACRRQIPCLLARFSLMI